MTGGCYSSHVQVSTYFWPHVPDKLQFTSTSRFRSQQRTRLMKCLPFVSHFLLFWMSDALLLHITLSLSLFPLELSSHWPLPGSLTDPRLGESWLGGSTAALCQTGPTKSNTFGTDFILFFSQNVLLGSVGSAALWRVEASGCEPVQTAGRFTARPTSMVVQLDGEQA